MTNRTHSLRNEGFTLIEFAIAATLLVVGVMGFVGAIFSSQIMVRATKEMDRANAAIVSILEDFREECAEDMEGTLQKRAGLTVFQHGAGAGAVAVRTRKTVFAPFLDNTNDYSDIAGSSVTAASVSSDGTKSWTTSKTESDGTVNWAKRVDMPDGTVLRLTKVTAADGTVMVESLNRMSSGENIANWVERTAQGMTKTVQRDVAGKVVTEITSFKDPNAGGHMVGHSEMQRLGTATKITIAVPMNETILDPPFDLNGDGDALDTEVKPEDMVATVLRVGITWRGVLGNRSLEFTTILARGEMKND